MSSEPGETAARSGRIGALLRAPAEAELPARVRHAIQRQQDSGEVVVGWVQLSLVVIFATLYGVSPKTFPEDAMFAPVPWALGLYFAFTVMRLTLAYRRRLPAWLVALSVVVDMALLLITIWSFHLQYEQPAAFYLKAPTLLYVFILIALRTLRFEARYVVLAGAVAAAGWLILVLFAILSDQRPDVITRDYVAYMTSSRILIGAEIDKIVSITVVTLILVVALFRARRLLVRSVTEGAAAADLSRFFAPDVARQITASETRIAAGQGETRQAAILFADIRGFTVFAEKAAADAVMAMLAEYQGRLVPVIRRHGGSIDKFLGDGIMATFGAAAPTATYAADALAALDELRAAGDAWNHDRAAAGADAVRIGFAAAVGPVVFGAVGDEDRLEYTVIGKAVNLAAKLEKHTKAEGVRALTTPDMLALAEAQGYRPRNRVEPLIKRRVEGIDRPIDIVVLGR